MLNFTRTSSLIAGLLLASTVGCSSIPTQTVRSQNPEAKFPTAQEGWQASGSSVQPTQFVIPQERKLNGELRGLAKNTLYDDTVSHHRYRPGQGGGLAQPVPATPIGVQGQAPYARWGNFNQQPCPSGPYAGFNKAPHMYQEQQWDHGGRRHVGQYDYHTYSYKQPRCLKYPAPNQPAGAVSYPYYTHKGPSCFFFKGTTSE